MIKTGNRALLLLAQAIAVLAGTLADPAEEELVDDQHAREVEPAVRRADAVEAAEAGGRAPSRRCRCRGRCRTGLAPPPKPSRRTSLGDLLPKARCRLEPRHPGSANRPSSAVVWTKILKFVGTTGLVSGKERA